MGRNPVPKQEWREGELYELKGTGVGEQCVGSVTRRDANGELSRTVLFCFFNDSFWEAVWSVFQSGYYKGEKAGYEKAQADMRRAMGINS